MNKLLDFLVRMCIISFGFLGSLPLQGKMREVKVGVYDNAPIVFRQADGHYSGFSVDILRHIAQKEGWQLTFIHGSWPDCLSRLESGVIDLQVYIAYSTERAKKYDFSAVALMHNWGQVFNLINQPYSSLFELAGKKVAILKGGIHAVAFQNLIQKFNIKTTLVEFSSHDAVFQSIAAGKVSAGVANRIFGMSNKDIYSLSASPLVFNPIEIRYAAPKGTNSDLLNTIDRHLTIMKQNKTSIYYKLFDKSLPGASKKQIPSWLLILIGGLLAVLLAAIVYIRLLRRSKAETVFNRAVMDNMAEGVYLVLLKDKTIVYANPKFELMFGYDPGEMLGQPVSIVNAPTQLSTDDTAANIFAVLHKTGEWRGEVLNIKKDGTVFWCFANVSRINHPVHGEVVISIHSDISEQKKSREKIKWQENETRRVEKLLHQKTEQALEKSEERFRIIFEQAAVGVALIDTNTGCFIQINRRYCTLVGYTKEEMLNKPYMAITYPEDLDEDQVHMQRLIAGEIRDFSLHTRYQCKDGSMVWVNLTVSPTWQPGEHPSFHIAVVEDITNTKNMEIHLRQTKESAEIANHAKSEFLAIMSHEIRTPLNAILGMAAIIQNTPLNGQQTGYMEILVQAGKNLLSLITDILDLAQIESGRLVLQKKPIHLAKLLQEAIDVQTHNAVQKGLDLGLQLGPRTPDRFIGDEKRLRQVLLNLIGNAIKFTDQGAVKLQVLCPTPQTLVFSIEDSGIGIPQEKQALIFKPFSQADSSDTRQHGGVGLGLTICKRLVDAMKGQIWVESIVGKGSIFHVSIPLLDDAPLEHPLEHPLVLPAIESDNHLPKVNKSRSILLAEDMEANAVLIDVYLSDTPHRLVMVTDGRQAVQRIQAKEKYDLILMDIQMPFMDGIEATLKIRAWEKDQNIAPTPILALTARAMTGDKEKSLAAGCDDHITKPLTMEKLLDIIDKFTSD